MARTMFLYGMGIKIIDDHYFNTVSETIDTFLMDQLFNT